MGTPTEYFTISRVCRITGLAPEMLALVESVLGDRLEVQRTPAGNRLFSAEAVDCLQEVRRLLDDEGLSLDQVRDALFPGPAAEREPATARPGFDPTAAGVDGPEAPLEADPADEPVDARAADGLAPEPAVPDLPVEPTVDLLLEAAEGLVQENLRLRKAVDSLGERCLELEERMDRLASAGFLRRLFGLA